MSDRTTIRNFWMIFTAALALIVIVMAIATSSLEVSTTEGNDPTAVRASIPGGTPTHPMVEPEPWYKRAGTWLIGFLMAAILSGRFILLVGILLFYGFIVAYIMPDAWHKIRGRLWGKAVKPIPQKAPIGDKKQ